MCHDVVLDKVEELVAVAKRQICSRFSVLAERHSVLAIGSGRCEIRSPPPVVDAFGLGVADSYNHVSRVVGKFQAPCNVHCCEEECVAIHEIPIAAAQAWLGVLHFTGKDGIATYSEETGRVSSSGRTRSSLQHKGHATCTRKSPLSVRAIYSLVFCRYPCLFAVTSTAIM